MKVDIDALASELELASDEFQMYLDLETGEIFTVSSEEMRIAEDSAEDEQFESYTEWERGALLTALEICVNFARYKKLPKLSETEENYIMADFCGRIESEMVREQLLETIEGKGSFKRFRDAILKVGIEQDWFDFKSKQIKMMAIEWCNANAVPYE